MAKQPTFMLPIGIVAAAANLTPQAIRLYDAELKPTRGRNGYRLYDPATVTQFVAARARRAGGKAK